MKLRAQHIQKVMALLGPAFVAAVAYVDPGNFAANMSAGAEYGYLLLWVLIVANAMAALVQYLSAKVGLVTGKSLPQIVATKLGKKSRIAYWLQAELVAVATDLAEVVGGALALQMLFHIPLVVGGAITGLVSIVLLLVYSHREQKIYERIIIGLLMIIPIGFIVGLVMRPPQALPLLQGLIPHFSGQGTVLLAVAMLGATIMPHVIYLHSALSRNRHGQLKAAEAQRILHATKVDVGVAMLFAGGVNAMMLILAASVFKGNLAASTLNGIFESLIHVVSPGVALLFAVGLLVSGLASTAVGTQAGDVVMFGLLKRRIPPLVRRLVVIIPSIIILALGVDPTAALIVSQVALSFGIPFAIIPLALVSSSRAVMGSFRNSRTVAVIVTLIAAAVSILNIALLWLVVRGA